MDFQLGINIPSPEFRISHHHKIVLAGSCFTEHIAGFLNRAKFQTMQNPHGIIFNPFSVCKSLSDVIQATIYTENDLFLLNEYWHSWFHHSGFSDIDRNTVLQNINNSIQAHHSFLKDADYLIITVGSAFVYRLTQKNIFVSNNHRAPAQWFEKVLPEIQQISEALQQLHQQLNRFNSKLKIIYTISPVRHIRDGVVENNKSKARLTEAVHGMKDAWYFPAYELVIDVLRDYRFYDIDMVHPNYQATAFVWEKFVECCIDQAALPLIKKMEQIYKAKNHIPKNRNSIAHKKFMYEHYEMCMTLQNEFPYLNLADEINTFTV